MSILLSNDVPSFTRSRSFPEFSIAVYKDWITEGLETVKGLSRETHGRHKKAPIFVKW